MSLAFFDFDGTLTTKDTILSLGLLLVEGKKSKVMTKVALLILLSMTKYHMITNHIFKILFCRLLLMDRDEKEVENLLMKFFEKYLPEILDPWVMESLWHHRKCGDEIYLVSSNFDFFLRSLLPRWGIKGVIATSVEIVEGRFTGRLLGMTCHGKQKLIRVLDCFDASRVREAVGYGDSCSDLYLLQYVSRGYLIEHGENRTYSKLVSR